MNCPNCKETKLKVGENSTHIYMKCPKCGYAKGAKKKPGRN